MFKSPANRKEYWDIINAHWNDINHIINIYLPTFSKKWIDGTDLSSTLGEYIQELKETKNPRIVRAFHAAWWACPEENCGEWAYSSWNVLCVLCSEEWCLIEERESEDV